MQSVTLTNWQLQMITRHSVASAFGSAKGAIVADRIVGGKGKAGGFSSPLLAQVESWQRAVSSTCSQTQLGDPTPGMR